MPKYVGPYKIIACNRETSHYTLELPQELLSVGYTLPSMLAYSDPLSRTMMTASLTVKQHSFMTSETTPKENGWEIQ